MEADRSAGAAVWRFEAVRGRAAAEVAAVTGLCGALGALVAGWYSAQRTLDLPPTCVGGADSVLGFDEESCTLLCADGDASGPRIWACRLATDALELAHRAIARAGGSRAYAINARAVEVLAPTADDTELGAFEALVDRHRHRPPRPPPRPLR